MAETPIQLGSRLEPLTVYDAPLTIATQIWDGEFSPSIAAKTFTSPNSLTPSERDSLAQRLSKAAGDSSVARAAVGVLTNPWAWMLFLTSPVGERPVADLFRMASRFSLYAAERAPALASIGALTSQQALFGSRAGRAISRFVNGKEEMLRSPALIEYGDELEKVIKSNGLGANGLDWRAYPETSIERQRAKEISFALYAAKNGLNENRQVYRTVLGDNGLPELQLMDAPAEVAVNPREVLKRYGAEGLVDKTNALFRHTADKVFSDPRAVTRIWANAPQGIKDLNAKEIAGRAMVKDVMGDLAERVTSGQITEQQFYEHIQKTIIDPIKTDGNYMPLNVTETFKAGKRVDPSLHGDARWAAAMRAGNSTTPRAPVAAMMHPEDLQEMANVLGTTPALESKINQAQGMWDEALKDGSAVRFHRINPILATSKHVDSMAKTYAMFVQDIGDGVREVDSQLAGKLKPWNLLDENAASHRQAIDGTRAGLDKTIKEIEGTAAEPRGGFSIADVLYADHGVAQNWWQRDTISKIVIPRLMGKVGTSSMMKLSMVTKAKEMAEAFTSTAAATHIAGSGELGSKFIQGLKDYAVSTDEAFEEGEKLQRFITKTLYGGALGYNVPSAIINMTQPFGLAASWVGVDNVLKGYGEAFKEFGAYVGKRWEQGFKPISSYERGKLLRETHKFANHNGEDLLEVAGDTLANFEGNIINSMAGEHKIKGRLSRIFFEYPMAMFKQAEVINRNVAAHATNFRNIEARAAGTAISEATASENIRNVVRETQYGGHWMNTPQAFMPEGASMGQRGFITGRLFANPLARQFLTYPLRSFTSWTYTTPRIAGREGINAFKGFINDTARGMAISSIGYEAVKGLTGSDISRAGFFAGVTDIIPGVSQGRLDERDAGSPIPMPPVVDIPLDVVKSFITDDAALFGHTMSRLIPGGVALGRALGSVPELPMMRFVGQSRYADWNSMNSLGTVPVFDSTGNLIDMRTPARLILEGLGADMGAFKDETQMMQYLLKQRDNIVDYRREYMNMVYGGRSDQAEVLAGEFQRRFKVPLTVTKAQWEEFATRRGTPRVERQLDRMPEDVRDQYIKTVGETIPTEDFGVKNAEFIAKTKAAERTREQAYTIDPQVAAYIRNQIAKGKAPGQRRADTPSDSDWGPFKASDFHV